MCRALAWAEAVGWAQQWPRPQRRGLGMAAEHDLKIKALTTATAGPPQLILNSKDRRCAATAAAQLGK